MTRPHLADSLFNARHGLALLCAASAADPEILWTHTAGARALLRRIDADLAEVERIRLAAAGGEG